MDEEEWPADTTQRRIRPNFSGWMFDTELQLERLCRKAAKLAITEFMAGMVIDITNYAIDGKTPTDTVSILAFSMAPGTEEQIRIQRPLAEVLAEDIISHGGEDLEPLLAVLEAAVARIKAEMVR